MFIFKLKEALRTKNKSINLRFIADSYRCKFADDVAYEVAALFTHWASHLAVNDVCRDLGEVGYEVHEGRPGFTIA